MLDLAKTFFWQFKEWTEEKVGKIQVHKTAKRFSTQSGFPGTQ